MSPTTHAGNSHPTVLPEQFPLQDSSNSAPIDPNIVSTAELYEGEVVVESEMLVEATRPPTTLREAEGSRWVVVPRGFVLPPIKPVDIGHLSFHFDEDHCATFLVEASVMEDPVICEGLIREIHESYVDTLSNEAHLEANPNPQDVLVDEYDPAPRIIVPKTPGIIVPGKSIVQPSDWSGFDFISEYTAWADVVEIPREIHTSQGVQLVASLLNHNRVFIRHSDFEYPLDLWQLLLTESGGGRSSIIRGIKRLLRAAGLVGYVKDSDWGSVPAMIQHFAENPFSLFFWSEFSERLDFFNKQGGKRWFTDRYDDTELPDSRTYRRNPNSTTSTPPIVFTQPPRINITAASSDGWFFENMETGDSTGGFLPRWMLIRTRKMKDVPTPPLLDRRIQAELVERLKHIATITGEADISEILPLYEAWYTPTRERFEQASANLGRIYFSRHRGLTLKLSVVYEVSRTGSLRVSPASWDRAVVTSRQLEKTLFELLDTGMNQYGWEITQVESLIREAGPGGISQYEFNRTLRGMKDVDKHLWKLLAEEVIQKNKRQPSRGRPATFYVHRDVVAEG